MNSSKYRQQNGSIYQGRERLTGKLVEGILYSHPHNSLTSLILEVNSDYSFLFTDSKVMVPVHQVYQKSVRLVINAEKIRYPNGNPVIEGDLICFTSSCRTWVCYGEVKVGKYYQESINGKIGTIPCYGCFVEVFWAKPADENDNLLTFADNFKHSQIQQSIYEVLELCSENICLVGNSFDNPELPELIRRI